MVHRLRLRNLAAALAPSGAAETTTAPAALGESGAADLTIGVCHAAYPCVPVLQRKLPQITSVFQEWSAEDMLPRMPEVDVLCVSGAWDDKFLDNAPNLKSVMTPTTALAPSSHLCKMQVRLPIQCGCEVERVPAQIHPEYRCWLQPVPTRGATEAWDCFVQRRRGESRPCTALLSLPQLPC